MTKQEMKQAVEACWAAATEAEMPGTYPMVLADNQFGQRTYDGIRLQAFYTLLAGSLAPRNVTVKHEQPREPWQGDEP